MKKMKICNYEILNFDAEPLIYSDHGITRITNPQLVRALQDLTKHRNKTVTELQLGKVLSDYCLDPQEAKDYLRRLEIIDNLRPPPVLTNTIIYCDWYISQSTKDQIASSAQGILEVKGIAENPTFSAHTPTLFILVYTKLDLTELRGIYYDIIDKNPKSAISVGFTSGNVFHLTEPHIPAVNNPCAFCTLDRIIYYQNMRGSHHHWSKLLAFCHSENIALPKKELEGMESALVLGLLVRVANRLTCNQQRKSTQDRLLHSTTLDLETGSLQEAPSVHWSPCKCLEEKK